MKFTKLSVTKKEIFKLAHDVTKEAIQKGDNYAVTFAAVLKEIYSAIKLESEYAKKIIKNTISAYFSTTKTEYSFHDSWFKFSPEYATTVNQMSEE